VDERSVDRGDQDRRQARVLVELTVNGRYQWRLKASNGRVVATSSAVYGDPEEAERALEKLRSQADHLLARISHVKEGAGWVWVLMSSRGESEARSMRAYERYATCQAAFRTFVALLVETGT
jgi:uncharacterized protein YegP (UPF0339 family)